MLLSILFLSACSSKPPSADWDTGGPNSSWDSDWRDEASPEPAAPSADSCTLGVIDICIEANEPDNEAWCTGLPASYEAAYSADPCPAGATGVCSDIPAGGDYSESGATVYYYDWDRDWEVFCAEQGGTYE